jgi:hypothetical protein
MLDPRDGQSRETIANTIRLDKLLELCRTSENTPNTRNNKQFGVINQSIAWAIGIVALLEHGRKIRWMS